MAFNKNIIHECTVSSVPEVVNPTSALPLARSNFMIYQQVSTLYGCDALTPQPRKFYLVSQYNSDHPTLPF